MNNKFRLRPIKIIPHKPRKTTRRIFLKGGAASFAGLVISPLSYGRAIGIDNIPDDSEVIQEMASKLLSSTTDIDNNIVSECDSATSYLKGDINHDCTVNEEDLKIMARNWLSSDSSALGNIDCSYTYYPDSASSRIFVDYRDFARLTKDWGKTSACSHL
jgi:hypothetical protein